MRIAYTAGGWLNGFHTVTGKQLSDFIRKLSIMRNCVLSRLETLVLKAMEIFLVN